VVDPIKIKTLEYVLSVCGFMNGAKSMQICKSLHKCIVCPGSSMGHADTN